MQKVVRNTDAVETLHKFYIKNGEAADSFITALYKLAEHCNYGNLCEEMICDRLVAGIRDSKLSEKLQLDYALTPERAITQIRQR